MSLLLLDDTRPPIDTAKLKTRPRAGMSLATLIHNPKHNLPEIVRIFNGCGVQWTRINLCSASWTNPTSYMPFLQEADGRWNLYRWDPRYWDRLVDVRERMNAANVVCQFTFLDLRNWSRRESSLDQTFTPWRHNVNGIVWEREDTSLYRLPDAWCEAYIQKAAPLLALDVNYLQPGNEMPEKALHIRIMEMVRTVVPGALIDTNRNEDTPTQARNMKVGQPGSFDTISFHGLKLKQPSDLDRVYTYWDEKTKRMKPLSIPTFRALLESGFDTQRITFSSDGARVSDDPVETYDYPKLKAFFREVFHTYGANIEHQSRTKMSSAPNHHLLEADWFASVIAKGAS
jgi:hypothetical protein